MAGGIHNIRQELTWVLYPLSGNTTHHMANMAKISFGQACATRGTISLQWILLACECSRHTYMNIQDWANADRAEKLYKRCKKIERRVIWRKRDREAAIVTLPLKADA